MPIYNSPHSPACRYLSIRAGDADPSVRPNREFPECPLCRPVRTYPALFFLTCSSGLAVYLLHQFVNRPFQLLIPALINHSRHVFHPDDRFSLVILHPLIRHVPGTDRHHTPPGPIRQSFPTCKATGTRYRHAYCFTYPELCIGRSIAVAIRIHRFVNQRKCGPGPSRCRFSSYIFIGCCIGIELPPRKEHRQICDKLSAPVKPCVDNHAVPVAVLTQHLLNHIPVRAISHSRDVDIPQPAVTSLIHLFFVHADRKSTRLNSSHVTISYA